jgi:predicted transcriptional regulator
MPDLGSLDREVMQLIWANRRLTAETVREKLARRLKESTVHTVLRRLEEKRDINHDVDRRTYVYQATHPRRKVAASTVRRSSICFATDRSRRFLSAWSTVPCSTSGNCAPWPRRSRRRREGSGNVAPAVTGGVRFASCWCIMEPGFRHRSSKARNALTECGCTRRKRTCVARACMLRIVALQNIMPHVELATS